MSEPKGHDRAKDEPRPQKGERAEKGDARRDNPPHEGPTRPGGSSRGQPGSESNSEKGD